MADPDEQAAALDRSLAALDDGASLERVLAADAANAAWLRPLLLAAQAAGAGADLPRVPVGGQVFNRSQFLAAADRRPNLALAGAGRRAQRAGWRTNPAGAHWLARAVAATLVVVGGLGLGGYGAVAASAQSLPGDPLYAVKRGVEQTEMMLAANPASRSQLQSEFDDRRVREVQAVASAGRQVAVDFTGTLISMNGLQGQNWFVSGIAVRVDPQVTVTGTPRVGARVRIEGAVRTAGLVQAQRVTVLADDNLPTPLPTTGPTASATPGPRSPTAFAPTAHAPDDTLTPASSPEPETTDANATEDHGGGPEPSATYTPASTQDGGPGPAASNTPQPTDNDGGGPGPTATRTPRPTDDDHSGGPGPSGSYTPRPTEQDDDHVVTRTPQPTNDVGGAVGTSPSHTPKPDD